MLYSYRYFLCVISLVLLMQACTTEPKLQLQAIKTEVRPSFFETVWGNGKTEREGNREIIRSESSYSYDIIPKKNGKKEGIALRYDKRSKNILFETSYKNGVRNGWERKYSPEGAWLYKAILYKNGKKQELRKYNNKGEMVYVLPYLNGEKHGVEQVFSYTSGSLQKRTTYVNGTKKKIVMYCKGKKSFQVEMNGCRKGIERSWYCGTTILKSETPYRHCKRQGVEKSYDAQGKLNYMIPYRYGQKEGEVKGYYPNGKIKYKVTYHADKVDEVGYVYDSKGKRERIDYDTLMKFKDRLPTHISDWRIE